MARERPKRFRVTARDNNGDIFAFESTDRDRATRKLEQFQGRRELHDLQLETSWKVGDRSKRFRVTGTDKNGDVHAFETGDRDRARTMQEEFKNRFPDVGQESLPWL